MNQDREDNTVKTVEQSKAYILRELFLSTFMLLCGILEVIAESIY